jgi:hypothetical protein
MMATDTTSRFSLDSPDSASSSIASASGSKKRARCAHPAPSGASDSLNGSPRRYATERFVEIVWRGVQSAEDPRTIRLWAHVSGTSRSPLSTLCRMLGISPRGARDFTRLFRALVIAHGIAHGHSSALHDVLDEDESATLLELFDRAGVECSPTLTPLEFLERQQLVRNVDVVNALKLVLQRA